MPTKTALYRSLPFCRIDLDQLPHHLDMLRQAFFEQVSHPRVISNSDIGPGVVATARRRQDHRVIWDARARRNLYQRSDLAVLCLCEHVLQLTRARTRHARGTLKPITYLTHSSAASHPSAYAYVGASPDAPLDNCAGANDDEPV